MTRKVVVDAAAAEEADAQVRYYRERAGESISAVVFYVDGEVVHVVATEALRRRPGYWRNRIR
jgi:hypothetical protein